jgi:hypothetical protein
MQWECEYETSEECAAAVAWHWWLLRSKSVLGTGSKVEQALNGSAPLTAAVIRHVLSHRQ